MDVSGMKAEWLRCQMTATVIFMTLTGVSKNFAWKWLMILASIVLTGRINSPISNQHPARMFGDDHSWWEAILLPFMDPWPQTSDHRQKVLEDSSRWWFAAPDDGNDDEDDDNVWILPVGMKHLLSVLIMFMIKWWAVKLLLPLYIFIGEGEKLQK